MAWRMAGTYVANCNCQLICPCSVDGKPTSATGECDSAFVFLIRSGNLDDVDLSGLTVGMYLYLPSNFTAGNIKAQVIVDESATEEQAKAIERIVTGQEGGTWAEFAPLMSEIGPMQRAKVTFRDGDKPSGAIGSVGLAFDPILSAEGERAKIVNAPFAFGPEYFIGTSSGTHEAHGRTGQHVYGEVGNIEFSG